MQLSLLARQILEGASWFFLAFLIFSGLVWLIQLVVSYYRLRKYVRSLRYIDYKRFLDSEHMVPVSMIVPVAAEDCNAKDALENLLSLDFPEYEVIAVFYGEHTRLPQELIGSLRLLPFRQPYKRSIQTGEIQTIYRSAKDFRLIVLEKPNGDRADALNAGVNLSSYPIVMTADPNGFFERDALIKIVYSFVSDPTCVSVGGAARVLNEEAHHWIERRQLDLMQKNERLRALYTNCLASEGTGAQLSVCDSFFAFKKTALLESGGFHPCGAGEESDLLLRLHALMRRKKRRMTARFLPDPICSLVPLERMREITRERKEWNAALRNALRKKEHGYSDAVAGGLFYFWLFEAFAPLAETAGYVVVAAAWLLGAVGPWFAASYYILSILLGAALSTGAMLLEENAFQDKPDAGRTLWLFVYSIVENFGYRQMTRACRIGWGRSRSKG